MVLKKLLERSAKNPTDNPVLGDVRLAQSFIIARLLAGKLWEGWHRGDDLLGLASFARLSQLRKAAQVWMYQDPRFNPAVVIHLKRSHQSSHSLKVETSSSILTHLLFGYQSNKWLQL